MSRLYKKWQDAMLLDEEVQRVFGYNSKEHHRVYDIRAFWANEHFDSGCPIDTPSADVLLKRMEEEERLIEKEKRHVRR